ncbi:MAG: ABC transporter ATP-binding protein [Candidatus Cloacimonetes bacterium]|nr:ABC transporter ATP-binding protein [Candidatus Cloacimonadota bacterium]MBL7086336.1 ABC transporter ATP-binding protein [Candidatus Cloacimonadota bacterium]
MKLFFRILKYLKKVWINVIAGIIVLMIYATFSGISLGIIYPIVDKIFVKQSVEEWETAKGKVSSVEQRNMFLETKDLFRNCINSIKENWNKEDRLKLIKADIGFYFQNFLERNSKKVVLEILLIIGIILFLIKVLSGYLQKIIFQQLEEKMIMWIRNDFYHAILQKPLEFFHNHKVGELISRATNDVKLVKIMTLTSATTLLRNFLLISVYIIIMFSVSWQLSLITLIVVVPVYLIVGIIARKMKKYSKRVQQKFADITSILQEAVLNIRIVLAFAMRNYERLRFYKENKKLYRKSVKMVRTEAIATPFTELMGVLITFVLIGYGGILVLNPYNPMTAGKFFLFLAALLSTLHPLKELSAVYTQINKGLASAERVFGVIDEPVRQPADKENALEINVFTDKIGFNHVCFKYTGSNEVISNINFEVKKGESIAFVGTSGGGKSTLMDLLIRFYDPTEGDITIDGKDIRDYKIDDLRNLMGVVTQEVVLFDDTVSNNISYGKLNAPVKDIIKAAKAANAHNFITKMEKGYDTIIGERGVKISGGQRQRLAIARAILKNPQILIFDEATSSLDSESEFLVQEAINRLMKDRTTLIIAHRLSTIRNCKRIMVIDKGEVFEQGTHKELLAKKGLYKKFYDMQFRENVPIKENKKFQSANSK